MKRIMFCFSAGIFLIGAFFYLQTDSKLKTYVMRLLNEDTLYLKNGNILRGWIWDEKDGVVVGETAQNEIFLFNKNEYLEIERDKPLHYLRELI